MRGTAAAQAIAQRSTACLVRKSTSASVASMASMASIASRASVTTHTPTLARASLNPPTTTSPHRYFSQTTACAKKAKKEKGAGEPSKKATKSSSGSDADADDGAGGTHPAADPKDPFTFADVESRWQRSEAHHEEKFKELRRSIASSDGSGGADVDAMGRIKVSYKAADAQGASDVPLSQLALVIPRAGGRVVELRMHSAEYKKAITSAVQKHDAIFHGQQPQPDPNDELVLLVKTGPAGGAGAAGGAAGVAAENARRVSELANAWRTQIRNATSRRSKTHAAWKKDGTVVPDDFRRLEKELLKGQEKRMARVDALEKEVLAVVNKRR